MFSDFRAKLYEVYRSIPNLGTGEEFTRHLAQTEETVLRPVLDRAEREARRGFLSRLGVDLTGIAFSIAARVAFDAATGQLGWTTTAARETIGVFADGVKIRGSRNSLSVWTKLYRHHRTVGDELRPIQRQIGSHPQNGAWSIDDEPSMNVRITPGALLFDEMSLPTHDWPGGYAEGNYRACDCSSGLKWRFCCQSIRAN
jgi:hypothetical protein